MNPSIHNIAVEEDVYKFTLKGINVSLANALRRTVLNDIPTTVIYTQTYEDNQCKIDVNTTRLHNEILKQRLSCIPVHIKELDILPENYCLELDMKNETDNIIIITTEDFRIKNKNNGNYLTKNEVSKIFPVCPRTNMYIDFARLRPSVGNIPGEQIKLTAEFSVHTANENSMFNVVSICAYGNTVDKLKADEIWSEYKNKLLSEQVSKDEIEMQKKNFYLLDAQRQFVPDSFDFTIQTVGVYSNKEIIKKACQVLIDKFTKFMVALESDVVPINISETTMDNCYDIILENEDYTMGKSLEFVLYNSYYENTEIMNFCGFKKYHPHDTDSVIRVAYKDKNDKNAVKTHLINSTEKCKKVFEEIMRLF